MSRNFLSNIFVGIMCLTFYTSSLRSQSVLSPAPSSSQLAMSTYEDSLKKLNLAIAKVKTEEEKLAYNRQFISLLEHVLSQPVAYAFRFDSLRYVSKVESPDKSFRIFTWDIEKTDGTYLYYGFIQMAPISDTDPCKLFALTDKSADITKKLELYSSDNKKWLGMLYYKVIYTRYKKKKYYTLLGWEGNDKLSCKKVIDVLTFAQDGTPHFGESIFNTSFIKNDKKYNIEFSSGLMPKRIIFEYSAKVVMSLRYNEPLNTIVFDHLAPPNASLKGQYTYYGPDLSYDGFKWEKGKWNYIPDQDARERKSEMDKYYIAPKDEKVEIKNSN